MSLIVRKPDFCLCENKGADQLRSNCEADQRLCFRYTDSTISLLLKSQISSFFLCQAWSETPKTGFLTSWLKLSRQHVSCHDAISITAITKKRMTEEKKLNVGLQKYTVLRRDYVHQKHDVSFGRHF